MKQRWIDTPTFDLIFILLPAWIVSLAIFCIPGLRQNTQDISPLAWLILVLMIDVAHVHSTLYRTYFDADFMRQNNRLLFITPLLCWIGGVLLYSLGSQFFWSALAYLAVYHFIRQQYGFFRFYNFDAHKYWKYFDQSLLYLSMIYPLLYWHTHLPLNFHWFIEGDFISLPYPFLERFMFKIYLWAWMIYTVKELYFFFKTRSFLLGKNLLLGGTALSWYTGIVFLNADLPFTFTNVIPHGIPYVALIWIYGKKQSSQQRLESRRLTQDTFIKKNFYKLSFLPLFIGLLWGFAYLEEALWDGFIWRDHLQLFPLFNLLHPIRQTASLSWLIPLLALPQATHYVLDGFIWRWKKDQNLKEVFHT